MIRKIKNYATIVLAALTLSMPALVPAAVYAQGSDDIQGPLCKGADTLSFDDTASSPCTVNGDASDKVTNIIKTIINIVSVVVGVIAVIMIVFGGLKYITSGGESSNISSAKNTIIYAIIGLVVVALAQFIVRFVLDKAINTTAG